MRVEMPTLTSKMSGGPLDRYRQICTMQPNGTSRMGRICSMQPSWRAQMGQ